MAWVAIFKKFNHPYFLTFKQAKRFEETIRKGQKGTKVVFWKISKLVLGQARNEAVEDEDFYGRKFTPCIWTVFNIDQIEGIEFASNETKARVVTPLETCEQIIS
ncbi:ArdC-like ssDNA-binding domain-containing protein [Algoriphagus sp.]|uniref:ArdC-like ssDNA-binding domain-containing protein n=1 Tax=Algoriphagus sp. TaxID=1872435 RepID=UPI00326C25D8